MDQIVSNEIDNLELSSNSIDNSTNIINFVRISFDEQRIMNDQLFENDEQKFEMNNQPHYIVIPRQMRIQIMSVMNNNDPYHDYEIIERGNIYLLAKKLKKIVCPIINQEIYINQVFKKNKSFAYNPYIINFSRHKIYNLPETYRIYITNNTKLNIYTDYYFNIYAVPKFIDSRKVN